MESDAKTPEEYINQLPEDRKIAIERLRKVIKENIPDGFHEEINYKMIGFVVPLSLFPEGYLGKKDIPLPFINIASQKNYISLYHNGLYAYPELLEWFKEEYAKTCPTKLNMGKSCVRFSNTKVIPYDLIGKLATKITIEEWIDLYKNKNLKPG